MNDLAVIEGGGGVRLTEITGPPSPAEWSALKEQASVIAKSGLAPKAVSTPEKILVIAMKARELSVPPIQGLSHIHIVEGKPTLSAELMTALVRRAGHKLRVVEWDNNGCTIETVRADDPGHPQRTSFTRDDASVAGLLGKDVWKKYFQAMAFARVVSKGCRAHMADILMGASYVPEELGAHVDGDGQVIDTESTVKGEVEIESGRLGASRPDSMVEAQVAQGSPRASEDETMDLKSLMVEAGVDRASIEKRYGPVEEMHPAQVKKWREQLYQRVNSRGVSEESENVEVVDQPPQVGRPRGYITDEQAYQVQGEAQRIYPNAGEDEALAIIERQIGHNLQVLNTREADALLTELKRRPADEEVGL